MKSTLNSIKIFFILFAIISCSDDSGVPDHQPFPGYIKGIINGESFEYELGGYGRGSNYTYSTSFEPPSKSLDFSQSLTVRFKTDFCSNNCEWKPISSDDLLEVINDVDWVLSSSEELGISIIYLDGTEEIYYSDINAELNTDNYFKLDTAYIDGFDLSADFHEPYERIIVVAGTFYSKLTNANDNSDQITLEAEFKGFLNSESEW